MISTGSRYESGRLHVDGDTTYVQRVFPTIRSLQFRLHTWTEADRLDILAARYFGDPKKWWRIMDLNPAIQGPGDLVPGMRIRVPNV